MNFSFSHPWVLTFLLLPLSLFAWEWTRRGFRVALPLDQGLTNRSRAMSLLPSILKIASVIPALLLASAILLLAGPKKLGPPAQERLITNIEMCLDVSGSMSSQLGTGGSTRYEAAMKAINEFVDKRKGDAFGLTIFGGDVVRWVPLTKDTSAIKNATPFLDPATLPSALNSTRVGNALKYCNQVLNQQEVGDRLIVLLTDGFSSDLDGGAAANIGNLLAANKVVVHAVHVGDSAPPAQLSEVVSPTGGKVFSATNLASLQGVFDHIDRMSKAKTKQKEREAVDHFGFFAITGLSLAGLGLVSLFGVRYTPW